MPSAEPSTVTCAGCGTVAVRPPSRIVDGALGLPDDWFEMRRIPPLTRPQRRELVRRGQDARELVYACCLTCAQTYDAESGQRTRIFATGEFIVSDEDGYDHERA